MAKTKGPGFADALKRGFPVSSTPYTGQRPEGGLPFETDVNNPPAPAPTPNLEDLMGTGLAPASPEREGAGEIPQEQPAPQPAPAEPEPTVKLPPEAFNDLVPSPRAAFSDDPPEGWGTGQGNVAAVDPVTSQLDDVARARASLLEDAARAPGANPAPAPALPQPVVRRGSRVPEIRQALAKAAQHSTVRYRSRVIIGAAWQFDGHLHQAPDWVSREWLAYDEGPALAIPDVGLLRKDQWLIVQQVLDDDGGMGFEELKIMDDQVFRSLFMVSADG